MITFESRDGGKMVFSKSHEGLALVVTDINGKEVSISFPAMRWLEMLHQMRHQVMVSIKKGKAGGIER